MSFDIQLISAVITTSTLPGVLRPPLVTAKLRSGTRGHVCSSALPGRAKQVSATIIALKP